MRICLWILGLKGLGQPQNPYISTKDIKNRSLEKDDKGEAKSVWLLIARKLAIHLPLQDKTRLCFIWSLVQSYVYRLYQNNLKL